MGEQSALFPENEHVDYTKLLKFQWKVITNKEPDQNAGEVIGFSKEWIHPDFNPKGTRVCFRNSEGGFTSSKWWDYQDTYINDETAPTHYMPMPDSPKID